jgi:hypothetical protein
MFTGSENEVIEYKGHMYMIKNFHHFVWCEFCEEFLWGVAKQGYKCKQCKHILHDKCIEDHDHCQNEKKKQSVLKSQKQIVNAIKKKTFVARGTINQSNNVNNLEPSDIPTHVINYSLPPRERYEEVSRIYKDQILNVKNTLFKHIPEKFQNLATEFFHLLDKCLDDFGEEIRGVADGSGLDVGDALILNLAYELTDYCTSIVAVDNDGKIMHARNQDFEPTLKDILIHVIAVNDSGQELFRGITFAGFIGFPTGYIKKKYSISINAREEITGNIFDNVAAAVFARGIPSGYLVRKALEKRTNFKQIVNYITGENLISPTYFIIAGPGENEGCVISRNRLNNQDIWFLNPPTTWYLSVTNHDHWVDTVPDKIDQDQDHTIARLDCSKEKMNEVGRDNISLSTLNKVLVTPPVLNQFTLYTSLMCPKTGEFFSYKRLK